MVEGFSRGVESDRIYGINRMGMPEAPLSSIQ
jgi:hypothetical protein